LRFKLLVLEVVIFSSVLICLEFDCWFSLGRLVEGMKCEESLCFSLRVLELEVLLSMCKGNRLPVEEDEEGLEIEGMETSLYEEKLSIDEDFEVLCDASEKREELELDE
jgi:hypothetical protein